MSEDTKSFSTAALLSLATGTLFCQFSEMHEAAEFLMGHPIWTHHFANEQLWSDMKRALLEQHPMMPTTVEGVDAANYKNKLSEVEKTLGSHLSIHRGSGLTAMLPTDGIPDHLKDKTILVDTGAKK